MNENDENDIEQDDKYVQLEQQVKLLEKRCQELTESLKSRDFHILKITEMSNQLRVERDTLSKEILVLHQLQQQRELHRHYHTSSKDDSALPRSNLGSLEKMLKPQLAK